MSEQTNKDNAWGRLLPTLDEIRARPRQILRPHQQAALAEAAAVFLEGGESALAAHLEQQRLAKELSPAARRGRIVARSKSRKWHVCMKKSLTNGVTSCTN